MYYFYTIQRVLWEFFLVIFTLQKKGGKSIFKMKAYGEQVSKFQGCFWRGTWRRNVGRHWIHCKPKFIGGFIDVFFCAHVTFLKFFVFLKVDREWCGVFFDQKRSKSIFSCGVYREILVSIPLYSFENFAKIANIRRIKSLICSWQYETVIDFFLEGDPVWSQKMGHFRRFLGVFLKKKSFFL